MNTACIVVVCVLHFALCAMCIAMCEQCCGAGTGATRSRINIMRLRVSVQDVFYN
jgi:hypothetical protein